MLIVRRRAGESIVLDGSIEIVVTEIGPTKVKLAVRAPHDVSVQRKEMMEASELNQLAAKLSPDSRELLAQVLSTLFSKTSGEPSDMNFEARYSGHPQNEENLEPA